MREEIASDEEKIMDEVRFEELSAVSMRKKQ